MLSSHILQFITLCFHRDTDEWVLICDPPDNAVTNTFPIFISPFPHRDWSIFLAAQNRAALHFLIHHVCQHSNLLHWKLPHKSASNKGNRALKKHIFTITRSCGSVYWAQNKLSSNREKKMQSYSYSNCLYESKLTVQAVLKMSINFSAGYPFTCLAWQWIFNWSSDLQ